MEQNAAIQGGSTQSGRAIPLVLFSPNEGKNHLGFKITEEGTNFLLTIHDKIGVIAVVGKYRTEKSFQNRIILNKIETGFGVGSTINACTKVV